MASLLALLFSGPSAHAGSYIGAYQVAVPNPNTNPVTYTYIQTQYSGGTHYASNGPSSFAVTADTLLSGGGTSGSYGGTSSGNGAAGTYSDCSGAISTSWTWVPAAGQTMTTDPPPAQVIIMQTCNASASTGVSMSTQNWDTGLTQLTGQSGWVTYNPPSNPAMGGGATGTYYFVHAGGVTVSLDAISPVGHASKAPSSASVSYTATISPIILIPGGTTSDSSGGMNILVGQQATGTVNGIPAALLNNTANPPTYSWVISGTTFESWGVVSDPSN